MGRCPNKVYRYVISDDKVVSRPIEDATCLTQLSPDLWVPSRGRGYHTALRRLLLALDVFRGKADALYWPGQEK